MRRRDKDVNWKEMDEARLPDRISEGAALVLDLGRRETLEELSRRVRIRREGGYCGFDVLLFLLFFFAASATTGIRKFWDEIRPYSVRLAALADRKKLPSPASLSRALSVVELSLLRPMTEWLLSEGAGIDTILKHPSVQTYDARGEGWHVFDFDPTVTTLRQRALPEAEDLPAARRRSEQMAAPGYSGRKRGEVQFRRGTLQHAGSSAWLSATLAPGNSDGRVELEEALGVIVRTCQRLGHPLNRALLRIDGEFGWTPYYDLCRAKGVPFLTRLTRYELLDQPDVARALAEGPWHLVEDSLSGPRRSALDLGIVTVSPGRDTRRDDGTAYEPISLRVVVSRYPRLGEPDHGRVIDGWQYELFVVDVEPESLPAPDSITAYFGRGGEENRFSQEDRELGLDRIFSYHLPGQELAVAIGLWLWNLRLVRGFELAPPPAVRPVQEAYVAHQDTRGLSAESSTEGVVDPTDPFATSSAVAADDTAASSPSFAELVADDERPVNELTDQHATASGAMLTESSKDGRLAQDGSATDEALVTDPVESPVGPSDGGQDEQEDRGTEPAIDPILTELRRFDWNELLRDRPGWSFEPSTGHLVCPAGVELVLTTVPTRERLRGTTPLIFRRPQWGCQGCEVRSVCLHSSRPYIPKQTEVSVPTPIARRLRELLRERRLREGTFVQPAPTSKRPVIDRSTSTTPARFPVEPLPIASLPLFAVLTSLFLPAAARNLFRAAAASLSFSVHVCQPDPKPRLVLIAGSVAEKQHRRLTWTQRFERNALDPDAKVRIEIASNGALRRMLGDSSWKAAG